jgi:hypothetical protein
MRQFHRSIGSAAGHTTLAELFRPLEGINPELLDRLRRYVTEGADAGILDELERMPDAVTVLGLKFLVGGIFRSVATPRPIQWIDVLEHAAELPDQVLLRLAKVMSAPFGSGQFTVQAGGRAVVYHLFATLKALQPPRWLEPLLEAATTSGGNIAPRYTSSLLSAEVVENLLAADGYSPDLIYAPAFPRKSNDWGTIAMRDYLSGLPGYGARIALRRKLVLEALGDPSAVAQLQALEAFEKLQIPTQTFLEPIARLATSTAKTVREAASSLIVCAGPGVLPALRDLAESGKAEARSHALRLIARLGTDESKSYLHERAEHETLPAVKKILSELVGQAHAGEAAASEPLPAIDTFEGVALGEETRMALALWAKGVAAADLAEAFAWLVEPAPWRGNPRTTLAAPAKADVEGLKSLLKRPELTPLHVVRLLRLSRLLQVGTHPAQLGELDQAVSVDVFERLFASYLDTHTPRMGLRELAAAFRASALDDDLIARARFTHLLPRRFLWDDEATWPYFAERLDWLAKELDPPPTARRGWEARLHGTDERRREALNVLASFPQPPAQFIPRLWEIALGTLKADRPLAQRSLEKLPDCRTRVLEALRGGTIPMRAAAIDWFVRLRPESAVDALKAALESERSAQVKSVLVDALAALGNPSDERKPADDRSREALRQEAAKGLKAGIPSKYEWFPFDQLPLVRWRGDDAPVGPEIVSWLLVSAWKSKSAEPSAILRSHVALLREDDARGLGKLVLDRWLAEDLRPPTSEELLKRLASFFGWTGAATIDEIAQKRPDLAHMVEMEKNRPMSVRAEDKGILAMVAACAPTDVIGRIRAYMDEWYGNRAAQCRALIQVLAWIDHPEAVTVLLQISRRFRTASIRQEAETQVRRLAERKGVSLAELADQAIPDAGLDAQGKLILDFGPRRFVARLADDARVLLEDESGNSLKALPSPNKSDDPTLAAAAKKRLTELKKQVKEVVKSITFRLYESMCTQRAWRFADWQGTFLNHSIAARLCRRLVWTLDGHSSPATTFRPLDDGTLTDLDDNEVRAEADTMVRVAHRSTVPQEHAAGWLAHLADYEVPSLFSQFTRPVFRLPEESRSARVYPLALDQPLAVQPLSRRARGLGYDPAAFRLQDGGGLFLKYFPGAGLRVEINIADFDEEQNAKRLELTFRRGTVGSSPAGTSVAFVLSEIPPVLLSECYADLLSLGGSPTSAGQPESLEKD